MYFLFLQSRYSCNQFYSTDKNFTTGQHFSKRAFEVISMNKKVMKPDSLLEEEKKRNRNQLTCWNRKVLPVSTAAGIIKRAAITLTGIIKRRKKETIITEPLRQQQAEGGNRPQQPQRENENRPQQSENGNRGEKRDNRPRNNNNNNRNRGQKLGRNNEIRRPERGSNQERPQGQERSN